MSNEELIAEAREAQTVAFNDNEVGYALIIRALADALESQSAPLLADSREALIDVEKATSRHFGSALSRFVDSFNGDEAGDVDYVEALDGNNGWAMRGGNDVESVFAKAIDALLASGVVSLAADHICGDEYHTLAELYEYRMAYHAHAARGWLALDIPVVKSWRHSDGELCFGGGWFIVSATLPSGQATNHYKAKHWELFDVPEVDVPPAYDGHTPQIALQRLLEPVSLAADRDRAMKKAGWAECSDPGAFVNDVWDAKTPNPYRESEARND